MKRSDIYMRLFFVSLCTLFITLYTVISFPAENQALTSLIGLACGFGFGCCVLGIESLCKQLKINTFNLITVGLFFGFLLGQMLTLLLDTLLPATLAAENASIIGAIKVCTFLFTSYLGMTTTLRSENWIATLLSTDTPQASLSKARNFIVDISALYDSRIIDLATTGLVDTHLLVPQHIVQLCTDMSDSVDDSVRIRGKRCIDHLKKLESLPSLELQIVEDESTDVKDSLLKVLSLARNNNAYILTGEGSRLQKSNADGAKLINLNDLATAMKPLANSGEFLNIKIQRYGKEPHQGIGYLDDGTMVVVNGGADFIGELIKTQVLSVKHTTSGRIIFCNTMQESEAAERNEAEPSPQSYFAL